jgi:putative peptidoglycan lipid II flippase
MKHYVILLIVISFLSKLVGFGREVFLSYYFGAGSISDAYLISLTIPVVIYTLIGTTISTGFIPIYSKVCSAKGEEEGNRFTNNIINVLIIITTIFIILTFIFAEQIVSILAVGFDSKTLSLAILYTRISLFSAYFTMINSVLAGYLQTKEKFIYPALIGFLSNIVIMCSIVIGAKTNNIALAYGNVLATLFQTIFLMSNAYKIGYKYKPFINIFDSSIKDILKMAAPLFLGVSAAQINVIVDKSIASTVAVGGITALNYADRLNSFVLSSLVISLSSIIYPQMSKSYTMKDSKEYSRIINNTVILILIILIPTMFGTTIYSNEIVKIVFSRGAFDENAVKMTSACLAIYSFGIIGMGLKEIITKAYFSMQNTRVPAINSIVGIIINIFLSLLLSKFFGVYGIAFATSFTANITMIFLFIKLRNKIQGFTFADIIKVSFKVLLITIIASLSSYFCYNYLNDIFDFKIALILAILLFILIYFTIITFAKIEYVDNLISNLKTTLKTKLCSNK